MIGRGKFLCEIKAGERCYKAWTVVLGVIGCGEGLLYIGVGQSYIGSTGDICTFLDTIGTSMYEQWFGKCN